MTNPFIKIFVDGLRGGHSGININAVHCGLECGVIKKKIPSMDIVACGPNIFDCHTPGERLDIPSLERLWKLILKVLSNL